jgi:protein-disulfide isomerase
MNSIPAVLAHSLPRGFALTALLALAASSFAQEKPKPAAPAARPAAAATPTVAPEQKYKTNVKGPADAPIRVVEFADFMCPGCRAASGALREYFAQQGSDINLTFKNFPLEKTCNPGIGQSIHNGSCELALGAVCASELGSFWAYHDRIFSRAWEAATRQDVIDNGVAVGMNKAKLEACLASPEAKSKLALQIKEGFETVVQVTPTLVVNGRKLNATNEFSAAIEAERKKLPATPATAPSKK